MDLPFHLAKAEAFLIIDGSRVPGAFAIILVAEQYALATIAITIITIIIIVPVELIGCGRHHH